MYNLKIVDHGVNKLLIHAATQGNFINKILRKRNKTKLRVYISCNFIAVKFKNRQI